MRWLLTLLLAAGCHAGVAPAWLYSHTKLRTVVLWYPACGGVITGPHEITTVAHCCPSATYSESWAVSWDSEDNVQADAYPIDSAEVDGELCKLQVSISFRQWAEVGKANPGDYVWSLHHPMAYPFGGWDGGNVMPGHATNIVVSPGSSGGGLWNREGKLVGLWNTRCTSGCPKLGAGSFVEVE
jgi:hypothetical protein